MVWCETEKADISTFLSVVAHSGNYPTLLYLVSHVAVADLKSETKLNKVMFAQSDRY